MRQKKLDIEQKKFNKWRKKMDVEQKKFNKKRDKMASDMTRIYSSEKLLKSLKPSHRSKSCNKCRQRIQTGLYHVEKQRVLLEKKQTEVNKVGRRIGLATDHFLIRRGPLQIQRPIDVKNAHKKYTKAHVLSNTVAAVKKIRTLHIASRPSILNHAVHETKNPIQGTRAAGSKGYGSIG